MEQFCRFDPFDVRVTELQDIFASSRFRPCSGFCIPLVDAVISNLVWKIHVLFCSAEIISMALFVPSYFSKCKQPLTLVGLLHKFLISGMKVIGGLSCDRTVKHARIHICRTCSANLTHGCQEARASIFYAEHSENTFFG